MQIRHRFFNFACLLIYIYIYILFSRKFHFENFSAIKLSTYAVKSPFTAIRLSLVEIFLQAFRVWLEEDSDRIDLPYDIFHAMVDWFLEYR